MLTLISPAKTLDLAPVDRRPTEPRFADDAATLVTAARRQGIGGLGRLMSISEPLARLNRDRFRDWGRGRREARGLRLRGRHLCRARRREPAGGRAPPAQGHLRILSGLYGLLRPLDGIRPYRLEMGTRLPTRRGRDLLAFWGDRIARAVEADAEAAGARALLDCASRDYFAAVERAARACR